MWLRVKERTELQKSEVSARSSQVELGFGCKHGLIYIFQRSKIYVYFILLGLCTELYNYIACDKTFIPTRDVILLCYIPIGILRI